MLMTLLFLTANAGTWHNGNVDLPETLGEILTVGYAGQVQVSAKGSKGSVSFPAASIHVGACAEGRDESGLRYRACLTEESLEITITGGEASSVSAVVTDRRGQKLLDTSLTEKAEPQREQRQLQR